MVRPGRFTAGKGTQLVCPSVGLDKCRNFACTGILSLDHPARSESLYRLSYPSPVITDTRYNVVVLFSSFLAAGGALFRLQAVGCFFRNTPKVKHVCCFLFLSERFLATVGGRNTELRYLSRLLSKGVSRFVGITVR